MCIFAVGLEIVLGPPVDVALYNLEKGVKGPFLAIHTVFFAKIQDGMFSDALLFLFWTPSILFMGIFSALHIVD